jgi:hypothetical protein
MTEKSGGFVGGRYVEDLPATLRSTGEPPGPELTAGAPIDPSTAATASTADTAGCAGPGMTTGEGTPEIPVDERLGAASASVAKAVDDVVGAVRTLVGTEEGHQYMEAKVNSAGETLSSVLRDLQARVGSSLKKK